MFNEDEAEYDSLCEGVQKIVNGYTERTGRKMLIMWGVIDKDEEGHVSHFEGFNGSSGLGWQEACSLIVGCTSFVADYYGETGGENPNAHRTNLFV